MAPAEQMERDRSEVHVSIQCEQERFIRAGRTPQFEARLVVDGMTTRATTDQEARRALRSRIGDLVRLLEEMEGV